MIPAGRDHGLAPRLYNRCASRACVRHMPANFRRERVTLVVYKCGEARTEDYRNAMRLNESDATKHGSRPAANRARRVATAATPRARSQRASRASSIVRPGDDQVRLRAYELYLQRDGRPGDPLEDWLRAERELIGKTQ